MKKIILISGKARHGKDTVADIMKSLLEGRSTKVAVAHYLKDIATRFYGWNGEKDIAGRTLMQRLGTDIIREKIDEDFHINRLCEDIKIIYDDYDYVIVPDVRFINEIEFPRNIFGEDVVTIRVDRPGYTTELESNQKQHVSEVELDDYEFDYYVENSEGYDYLEFQIINIIRQMNKGVI